MKGVKEMVINGVRTVNYPYQVVDGEEQQDLHVGVLVEQIAKHIPEEAKAAVTIDASKIPNAFDRLVREKMGMPQVEEIDERAARRREKELLDLLERDGLLPKQEAADE